jgi:hypothetical protein
MPNDNPYDLLLDGEQQRQRAMLAGSLSTAVDINPDAFSAQRRVAKYLGYPTAAVEALPKETKTQAAVKQVTDATANSPALQNKYLEPDFARLAHDDAPKLTEIEQAVRQYGELKAWKGPEPTTGSVLTGLAQSLPQGLRAMREGLRQQMGDLFDTLGILPRTEQEKAEQLRRTAQAQGASAYTTPEFESSTAGAVYGGLTSVLRQAPGIALSVATGNPVPALASIGVQTQAEAYGKYRARGATPGMAAVGGLAEGAVEVGTELLPMGFLVNKLGKTGMTEFFTGMLARELPTEQVATLLQDAIDTAIANPDKTWQQYLNERPEAAYQTLVATITQSAVMAGAGAAARRAMRDTSRVNDAEGDAQRLTELFAKAGESKLRERDPSTFAELVQGVADQTDGAPKSVFIDAATLAEALKSPEAAEVFNQMPQSVQDQLPEALASGGTVELPIGDLVAHASGTPLEKVLLQNLRTAPDSLSQLEAQEAAGQAESYLQAEATRVIEEATNADAMRTSSEVVKANVLGQLNKTMRFRPEVNESYASLAGAFYTTMAGRLGITPEEMFAKYPLRITAEQPGGGVLNDSGLRPGEMNVEGYHFSMADRPTLSTGYFGTGLKGSAREDIQNATDPRIKQRLSFYFDKGTGIRPESGVGGRAHRVQLTGVYDSDADPLKLKGGDARAFESRLLDAGFRGYATRMDGSQPGQVIMLGPQTFQPELLGAQSRIENGKRVEPLPQQAPQWQTSASGTPEAMQALLERRQGNASWSSYDMQVVGGELQVRKKSDVLEQRGVQKPGKPVPVTVDAVANVESAFELANGQQFKTNRDLKLALQERVLEALKAAKVNLEDFNGGAEQYLVRVATMDAEIALRTNPNAVGWYNEKVTKALRVVALVHPEIQTDPQAKFAFVWAMAVTSNGLKVDKNFELAEQAYATFKTTGKMPTDVQAGKAQAAINNGLALFNEMLAKHGFEQLQSFMTTKATVKEIEAFSDLEVGGENLTTEVYGSAILGPKIGNGFFSNLYGRFEQLTMDRWLMRTWGRWTGTLVETNPEQVRAKRVQLRALIQGLDKDQKKAFEAIIKRKLTVGDADAVALAIWKSSQKPINRARMAEVADATDQAGQARLASIMGPLKKGQRRVSFGDELRKVGNALTNYNDGQKEAPSGPPERNRIRKVFGQVLEQLQQKYPALTMSDLQALLWYPEKRLYDAAKEAGEGDTGYEDDAAPDYANAAAKLAREKGVSDADIARTLQEVDDEIRAADSAAGTGRTGLGEGPTGQAPAGGVRQPDGVRGGAGLLEQQAGGLTDGRPEQTGTGNGAGRYSSGSLAPLEGAPAVAGAAGPDPRLVAVAEQYARDNGVNLRRQAAYAQVDPERAARIAAAYEAMPHAPRDPAVKEAYADLLRQTTEQYQALQAAGYKFWFMDPASDPYQGNPWNAMRDLRANQSMAVFPTEAGFGTGGQVNIGLADPNGGPNLDPAVVLEALRVVGAEVEASAVFSSDTEPTLVVKVKRALTKRQGDFLSGLADQEAIAQRTGDEKGALFGPKAEQWGPFNPTYFVTPTGARGDEVANPLLADTGITWAYGSPDGEQRPVLANDLFRAVHDAFGHGLEGAGFRAQGEENAWQAHRRLFTGSALGAITTETRGQNSWLNYGPHGETNQNAKVEDTVFAEQKTGLMPSWTWTEGVVPDEGAPAADLAQGEQAPRATFSPSQLEITLLENADLSSFLHEMGHFFLEVQADLATQPDAPQQIKDDLAATLKWFGVKADKKTGQTPEQVWAGLDLEGKRAYHERWAESFEQYLFEGKAPSVEMRGVFQRFRQFMLSAYKSLKAFMQGRNLRLSDEVRGVFDRLIATDEQIAEAQSLANFEAVFKSAKEAGMTPEEWAAYQEQNAAATTDATEDLQKKSLADMKWAAAARGKALRAAQADVKEKRDAMRAEVKAEVEALPVEQARAYIKGLRTSTPEQRDALKDWGDRREAALGRAREEVKAAFMATPEAQAVKGIKKGQLLAKNKKALENQAEAKVIAWEQQNPRPTPVLPEPQMDAIAEQFGFTSGDELAKALVEQPPAAQFIDALTEQRLLETYGEVVTADGMARAANEAVHNEARRRFVATELAAMQRAMSATAPTGKTTAKGRPLSVNVIVQAAKSFAETVVNRRKILDLKPAQHAAAATRAAAKALKLQAEGKTADAIAAKRDQLLSEYTARYTAQAAAEVKRSIDYLKKFDKASVREKLPADYLDQIDQMLERFDLRTSTTAREIDRRASLASWVAKQQEMGLDPVVPQDLLDNARLTSYKEMTVEEFRGLVDGVKSVEHLARLKSKLLAAKDKREFDAIVAEAVDSIREHGGKPRPVQLEPDGRIKKFFKGAWADHRKFNSLIRQMDGGLDNGPMYRILVRSMNDAGASEATRLEQATEALAKIYAPIEKLAGGFSGAKVFIPEIRNSLSRAGRLSIALNWGNPQNRQRVMDGDGWTEAQVNAILATLSPVELKFVNDVWAHIDTYWADIKAKQERVTGVAEDKVEAVPFELNGVQMRGGYYPIKYDTERSIKAEKQEALETAKQIMQGMVARPTTRRGHTKARVEEVKGRPVRKDLSVITQHVNQVVHDLAWHEWFIDANRILNDPRIAVAIREYHDNETARTLKETADAIAVGDAVHQGQIDRLLLLMRSNVSRSIMGASLTTALMQPFGLTQSMARVGVVPVLKGAARWAGDSVRMESTVGWINEKSEFMRLRSKTFNRELREISQRVQGKSKIAQVYDTSLFMLMQKLQLVADVPTWVGAYEKALAGGVDESAAVSLADEAVLGSQGGGTTKDLSAVQRNMPFLTQFYSYFNTTLNLVAEKTATTEFKDPKAVAGWMADMALLTVIPAILPALLTFLLKGGGEDDDAEKWAKRVLEWQAGYLFGMFVGLRELPTLWSPFDYAGPPAGKIVGDGKKAVSQAGQGEIDEPAVLATINLLGTAFGIPTIQATRSYKGWKAWSEGDAPATAILFGPPPRD